MTNFPMVWCVGMALLAGCTTTHSPSQAGAPKSDAGRGTAAKSGGAGSRAADAGAAASSSFGGAGSRAGDGGADPGADVLNPVDAGTRRNAATSTDKLDLLFMIDNSDSMADKQASLRNQAPRLVQVLTTGDVDGDGKKDFAPVTNLHLGVITSDMGLPGVDGIVNCTGLGQDGILQHHPSTQAQDCQQPSYPPFLSFVAGVNQPMLVGQDFACVASVGTGGCGFEHQLEATLKALWPSIDPMAAQNGGRNRIQFLTDPISGQGAFGHGDTDNIGFLRNDPVAGLSLIAVVVVSDEDDCSSSDTRPFTPPQYLAPNDPLLMEGMIVRCHFNQQALYPIQRYVNGLKALRPGNEQMVIFAAIVGVPTDLTGPDVLAKTDFSNPTAHDRFYQTILNDPRMQELVNDQGTADPADDKLVHSCVVDSALAAKNQGQLGAADPPRRIVQVAKEFGENGIVQSICQSDYGPALDAIVSVIGRRLGAPTTAAH